MTDDFEIDSYVSPNPTPEVLLACGPLDDVRRYLNVLKQTPHVTIAAEANDGRTGFFKVHVGGMTYRDFINLIQARPATVQMPFVRRAVPTGDHGRVDDVGNPHAPRVIVGLLADPATIARITEHLDWASLRPLSLGSAGEGVWFEPEADAADDYAVFVKEAEAGLYANASVVLLRQRVRS